MEREKKNDPEKVVLVVLSVEEVLRGNNAIGRMIEEGLHHQWSAEEVFLHPTLREEEVSLLYLKKVGVHVTVHRHHLDRGMRILNSSSCYTNVKKLKVSSTIVIISYQQFQQFKKVIATTKIQGTYEKKELQSSNWYENNYFL